MKGLYPSLGHHPPRVIYVREADHKIDTLHMAPTLIVRSHREEGHLKEYNNVKYLINMHINHIFFFHFKNASFPGNDSLVPALWLLSFNFNVFPFLALWHV